jgi:hypothetical protein
MATAADDRPIRVSAIRRSWRPQTSAAPTCYGGTCWSTASLRAAEDRRRRETDCQPACRCLTMKEVRLEPFATIGTRLSHPFFGPFALAFATKNWALFYVLGRAHDAPRKTIAAALETLDYWWLLAPVSVGVGYWLFAEWLAYPGHYFTRWAEISSGSGGHRDFRGRHPSAKRYRDCHRASGSPRG